MSIVTLTTDFGLADSYVAVMKGVILGIAPAAQLVDITHQIAPQNVREAAYVLSTALAHFPPDTVHLVVVDPGVGSARRPLALQVGAARFVGPDNGVLAPALASGPASIVHLDNPRYWRPVVSQTFHGRDIFAPAAAHLAAGVPLTRLGAPVDDPVLLDLAQPARLASGALRGQVVHVDRFGNLISDIPARWLAGAAWTVCIAGLELDGVQPTYASAAEGQLLALVSSGDTLEVAVRGGSAAQRLGVDAGEPVEVRPRAMANSPARPPAAA